jgi:hypothetical protein
MSEAAAALSGDNGGQETSVDTGTNETTWSSGFDEDTSAYVANKGWKDPSDVLESYRNLEKFVGGSKSLIEIPGVDAEPDKMEEFYNRLGRPESADKYELSVPDNAEKETVEWFKEKAHSLGLTNDQASKLFSDWNSMVDEKMQSHQEQVAQMQQEQLASLKKEWGGAFDSQIAAGKRAVNTLGYDQEALTALEEKLGTADMLKLFATIGSKMGEDSFVDGGRSDGAFGLTPAAAKQQLSDLKLDQGFMDQYLSGNPDALNKMKRLMEAAHG